jgi:hypothetical protein
MSFTMTMELLFLLWFWFFTGWLTRCKNVGEYAWLGTWFRGVEVGR